MTSTEPHIVADKVTRAFSDGTKHLTVLRDVHLEIAAGESVAIVGPSGAGKSTLLHILGGLDTPTSGTVRFDGTDIFALSERDRAAFRNREIGFVFQFHHLLPEFTALENVMMPGRIRGLAPAECEDDARRLLEQVGLGARLDHRPGELSGGEQQRVAVARALAPKPRCVLADEPTGNLDTKTGAEVHDLLVGLNEELGITLIIVTHNQSLATQVGRRVTLVDGQVSTGSDASAGA